jgi:hypothetical protein
MKPTKKIKCLTKTIDRIKVMRLYGDLFYALRTIINEYNPMDFGHLEVAPDEYDPEAATIIAQLEQKMTREEVHHVVFYDFKLYFSPIRLSKADFLEISNAIYLWMQDITLPEMHIDKLLIKMTQNEE